MTTGQAYNSVRPFLYKKQPYVASRTFVAMDPTVEVVKRNELHTFAVLPKRWVVERSFGWLEKSRRLWKNCERKLNTSRNMAVLAFLAILIKRL